MNAVSHRTDWPTGLGHTRPDRSPHGARDFAVQLTDPIDLSGRPQRQRRHVERRPRAAIVRSQRQELATVGPQRAPAAGQMLFDEMKWKCVVAGGDWSVGGEYRRGANLLEGFVERRGMPGEIG